MAATSCDQCDLLSKRILTDYTCPCI